MRILFVSGAMSPKLQNKMFEDGIKYGFAVQKFYGLLIDGLRKNSAQLDLLSMIPVAQKDYSYRFKSFGTEHIDGVKYKYVPFLKLNRIYHLFLTVYVFLYVFLWCLCNRKDAYVLYDVLIPSRCIGTILGAKLGRGKTVAIVTDMPGMNGEKQVKYEDMGNIGKLQMNMIHKSSAFVLLTKQMNEILNPLNRPYIIMEGLVPTELPNETVTKNITRDIMYAGGIMEAYGLGYLCQAFSRIDFDDIRLIIYGNGPYVTKIKEFVRLDSRIEYRGVAQNEEIVNTERRATLLVNPRFTGADYTLYSFPSKNIEYMLSGTPIITTKLAGIPHDYDEFIFTFDEETVDGYEITLRAALSLTTEELFKKGKEAQQYILKNKNSKIQVKRILDLTNRI